MEVDFKIIKWQDPDVQEVGKLAQEMETIVKCPSRKHKRTKKRRWKMMPPSAPKPSKRLKSKGKDLEKPHTYLGHLGVKERILVLSHRRAPKLAISEARMLHFESCAENVQPKIPRRAIPRQVLDFGERVRMDFLKLLLWDNDARSVTCLNFVCRGTLFQI